MSHNGCFEKKRVSANTGLLVHTAQYRVLIFAIYFIAIVGIPYAILMSTPSHHDRIIIFAIILSSMLILATIAAYAITRVTTSVREMRRAYAYFIGYSILSYALLAFVCPLVLVRSALASNMNTTNTISPVFAFIMSATPIILIVNYGMIILIATQQRALLRHATDTPVSPSTDHTQPIPRELAWDASIGWNTSISFYTAISFVAFVYGSYVLLIMGLAGSSGP